MVSHSLTDKWGCIIARISNSLISLSTNCSLRLAAKCFEKGGDMKRRDFALAYLSYTEIEEEEHTKRRGKHNNEMKQRLYKITSQLLEARGKTYFVSGSHTT